MVGEGWCGGVLANQFSDEGGPDLSHRSYGNSLTMAIFTKHEGQRNTESASMSQ
jgi:hypothetical protein